MWFNLKRLALGITLMILAAVVLLATDTSRRPPVRDRMPRVALLQHASQAILDEGFAGILEGLAEQGFVPDQSLILKRFNSENDMPTANTMATEIVNGDFDLAITMTTVSMQAVANVNREGKVKHVFALVSDPAGSGVGISRDDPYDHPPWMAGFGTLQPVARTFELARQMNPNLQRVGEVWNVSETNSEITTGIARKVTKDMGIELLEANVENAAGVLEGAGSVLARGAQAIWIGADVTVLTGADSLIAAARRAGVPVFTSIPGTADRGALFDVGANYHQVGHVAGVLAGEVLRGKDPATVAITNLVPETVVVNRGALSGLNDPWHASDDVLKTARLVGETAAPIAKVAAAPLEAKPGRRYRIGVVYFAPDPGADNCLQGFLDGLKVQGFEEGKNLEVSAAHAQGSIADIPAILQELDNRGLDLIVPMSTPVLTGACATVKQTPIVFTYIYDPIAAGAGTTFTDHRPNLTGVGSFPPLQETVDMLRRVVPSARRVGTIYNSSEANSRKAVGVARDLFTAAGIQLEEVSIINPSEVFEAAQALVARDVDAFWITGDNTAIQGFDAIVKVADGAGLPIINNDPEFVQRGALACVGIGFYKSGYAAASLAARVLRGESPASIAIENVTEKTVLINLDVARRLQISVPDEVVRVADVVIDSAAGSQKAGGKGDVSPATAVVPARPS